jgi:hypothetical protein
MLSVVLLVCACAKTDVKIPQRTVEPAKHVSTSTEAKTTEVIPSPECPTVDDAEDCADECEILIKQAESIVREARKVINTDRSTAWKTRISLWNQKERSWKEKVASLEKNCYLLLGADGTAVHPEIPIALQSIDRAGEWVEKSLEAATLGDLKLAGTYLKGAKAAFGFSTKILDGRLNARTRKNSVQIPKYIKKADEQLQRSREANNNSQGASK